MNALPGGCDRRASAGASWLLVMPGLCPVPIRTCECCHECRHERNCLKVNFKSSDLINYHNSLVISLGIFHSEAHSLFFWHSSIDLAPSLGSPAFQNQGWASLALWQWSPVIHLSYKVIIFKDCGYGVGACRIRNGRYAGRGVCVCVTERERDRMRKRERFSWIGIWSRIFISLYTYILTIQIKEWG